MRLPILFLSFFMATYAFSQDEKELSILNINPELLKDANAVVRLDQKNIEIQSVDKMSYQVTKVVTVFNKEGNDYASTVAYYDKEKKVKEIEAFFYDGNGNELEHIKKKDFDDYAAVDGFSLYIDNRLLHYRYVPTQYPYTLKFKYEIETSDTGALPSCYFLPGYGVSVEKSSYKIAYPSTDLKPVIKEHNLEQIQVDHQEVKGAVSYTASHLKALRWESLCPSFSALSPRLSIRLPVFNYKGYKAQIDNWEDMGVWIDEKLLAGRTVLEESTVTKAKSLVSGITDDLEKAKAIYKYVQENTRYISVQIGIGGLQPISAIDVDEVKYGDCKGLSNYTKALLEAVGVKSYYVVVQAGNAKVDFEPDFADLAQGNHVILTIPYNDEYYWIDCTSQIHPFGFVGDFTDDRNVLVVKPEGGEIVKTISYLDEENHQKLNADVIVKEDGSISGTVVMETKGIQYDDRFGLPNKAGDEITKHYKNYWNHINGINIDNFQFGNDKDNVVFTEKIEISATDYASRANDYLLLPLNVFNNNTYVPNRYRSRKLAFAIQRGFLDEDECIIHLPATLQLSELPEKIKIENKFGTYEMEVVSTSETELLFKRKLLIKHGSYEKDEYNDYRTFRRKVAKADNTKILLTKLGK